MSEKAKGLIHTLGDSSRLHLPLSIYLEEIPALANTPKIYFPIRILASFGIKKILIAGTAKTIATLQEALQNCDGFETDISYLLVTDNCSIVETISAANEYVAQSPLVIIRPLICTREAISDIRHQLQKCSGVTVFRFSQDDSQTDELTPSLLRIDVPSRFKIQDAIKQTEQSGNFEFLKKFCMENEIYQENRVKSISLRLCQIHQDNAAVIQAVAAALKSNAKGIGNETNVLSKNQRSVHQSELPS